MIVARRATGLKQACRHRVAADAASGRLAERNSERVELQPRAEMGKADAALKLDIEKDVAVEAAQAELVSVDERPVVLAADAEPDSDAVQARNELKARIAGLEQIKCQPLVHS